MAQQYALPERERTGFSAPTLGNLLPPVTPASGHSTPLPSRGPERIRTYPTYTHIYIIQNKEKSLQKLKWSTEGVGSIGKVLT